MPCIYATVKFSGFSHSGFDSSEYRVVDDVGNVVQTGSTEVVGSESGAAVALQIGPIDPRARSLRIELLDEKAMVESTTTFSFANVDTNGYRRD